MPANYLLFCYIIFLLLSGYTLPQSGPRAAGMCMIYEFERKKELMLYNNS